MTDTERLDKLENLLINSEQFANGIGFVPYATIGGAGDVFAVFELREGATVLAEEIVSSQYSLRAAIDAL